MSPFYNRPLAQPVQKFLNLLGQVEPLDVVAYGGAFKVTQSAAGNVTVLPAPSAGFAYRLHRFTTQNGADTSLVLGATSGVLYAAVGIGGNPVDRCDGQLCTEALNIDNNSGAVLACLFYDIMLTPLIQ